jgi:hypothetical protein
VSDDLTAFWIRADLEDPAFTGDEVRRLPAATRHLLETRSMIRQSENLRAIECDACGDGHLEEVEILTEPVGSRSRAYITCPEAGRVSVEMQRLQQWSVDLEAIARVVATSLELRERIISITPGRVWLLGARKFDERMCDVFLVRGIFLAGQPEGPGICHALGQLLVPGNSLPKSFSRRSRMAGP